jgi:predicted nucleic acid-binding protein
LKASPQVELIYVDKALDEQAWQLLKARQDKEWSLVDCSSFVVMQTFGITEALTTDHHFEHAGFVRLLTP